MNEFLSAMVAVRQLEPHISTVQLAQIALCIAATIPFKNKNDGVNPTYMEQLYHNIQVTRQRLPSLLSSPSSSFSSSSTTTHDDTDQDDAFWIASVQLAARLANEDVANFGTNDRYWFLDNTWSLLPETNTSLRSEYLYTILNYHEAVFKMNGFFRFLQPDMIFASFRSVPSDEHVAYLTTQATCNLTLGQKYIRAKLVSASVLAAFAVLTGGDAPISIFMGDLPSRQHGASQHLGDYLIHPSPPQAQEQEHNPPPPAIEEGASSNSGEDNGTTTTTTRPTKRAKTATPTTSTTAEADEPQDEVFQILVHGRRSESAFAIKASPLAAFLYAHLGVEGMAQMIWKREKLLAFPMTNDAAVQLLQALPRRAVHGIGLGLAEVAVSRRAAVQDLQATLVFEA
jgi:hypothetical protein